MKSILKKIVKHPKVLRSVLALMVALHNKLYAIISRLAVYSENEGIHPKHRLQDYHQWYCKHLQRDWRVLDIGCGNGRLACAMAEHCLTVTGIDLEADNVAQAKSSCDKPNVNIVCGDAVTYDFAATYDAVVLSNVLEHIEDRRSFLERIASLADVFLIRVPLRDRDWLTLYKQEQGFSYMLDPTHFIEYTEDEILSELCLAGLSIESYRVRYGEFYCVAVRQQLRG